MSSSPLIPAPSSAPTTPRGAPEPEYSLPAVVRAGPPKLVHPSLSGAHKAARIRRRTATGGSVDFYGLVELARDSNGRNILVPGANARWGTPGALPVRDVANYYPDVNIYDGRCEFRWARKGGETFAVAGPPPAGSRAEIAEALEEFAYAMDLARGRTAMMVPDGFADDAIGDFRAAARTRDSLVPAAAQN